MPEAKKKRGRPKKQWLPGHEPEVIQELEDAADNYYDAVQDRIPLTKAEDEAKDSLIDKMKEHKLDRYITQDGLVVAITAVSNVKVKKKKELDETSETEE